MFFTAMRLSLYIQREPVVYIRRPHIPNNGIKTCEALTTIKNEATYLYIGGENTKKGRGGFHLREILHQRPFFETLAKQSTQT
ncbi:hypothetical protein BVL40_01830 [Corynebacterium diphtheriae]|nr:hypothetical protein BVL40_01830 [Corynebacterium diphtheriae]